MDALTLLTASFDAWLLERTGPTASSPTRQGVRLDVFATSMRDSKVISANLHQLSDGATTVNATDVSQRITDLAATALVDRLDGGGCSLSAFGQATLGRWVALGVDDDTTANELIRQVVLVDEGISRSIPVYVNAQRFWGELVQLQPAEEWFGNTDALYMVSYLNHADSRGYNPWSLIKAASADLVAVSAADWDTWAGTTAVPPTWTKSVGAKLVTAVRGAAARYVGRLTFCMALEARRRALAGAAIGETIGSWEIPHA